MRWQTRAGWAALLAAIVAAAAWRTGFDPAVGAFVAAVMVCGHVAVRWPTVSATAAVTLVAIAAAPVAATGYALLSDTAPEQAALPLVTTVILIALIAHWMPYGRPWVTAVAGNLAVLVAAPLTVGAATGWPLPVMVTGWLMLAVVLLVCGGAPWLAAQATRLVPGRATRFADGHPVGEVLANLPSRMRVKRWDAAASPQRHQWLVMSRGRVCLVVAADRHTDHIVRRRQGRDLAVNQPLLRTAITAAAASADDVAARLRVRRREVGVVLVFATARLPGGGGVAAIGGDDAVHPRTVHLTELPALASLLHDTRAVAPPLPPHRRLRLTVRRRSTC